MNTKELTCINCPIGCDLIVEVDEEGNAVSVSGNSCPLGDRYARVEVKDPRRVVTSTVRLTGGAKPVVSVKTKETIPKASIFDVMAVIQKTVVPAPVSIGDVLVADIAGTGVDLVATENRAAR